jgi:putative oxidoreductase
MLTKILASDPVSPQKGLAVIRIITGLLMVYHGLEIFDPELIAGYTTWDVIKKLPAPTFMVYVGKGLELVTGICFCLGIFMRVASLFMVADMLFICFFVGNGKFYYEDQHPFLFALIALLFFFTGPGSWSLQPTVSRKNA